MQKHLKLVLWRNTSAYVLFGCFFKAFSRLNYSLGYGMEESKPLNNCFDCGALCRMWVKQTTEQTWRAEDFFIVPCQAHQASPHCRQQAESPASHTVLPTGKVKWACLWNSFGLHTVVHISCLMGWYTGRIFLSLRCLRILSTSSTVNLVLLLAMKKEWR